MKILHYQHNITIQPLGVYSLLFSCNLVHALSKYHLFNSGDDLIMRKIVFIELEH